MPDRNGVYRSFFRNDCSRLSTVACSRHSYRKHEDRLLLLNNNVIAIGNNNNIVKISRNI